MIEIDPILAAQAQARKEKASKAAKARKVYSNQYLSGKRTSAPESSKDAVRAEFAAARLEAHISGGRKMTPAQVASAKILMDKGKPSLQAVEQTFVEPAAITSEADLLALIIRLARDPGSRALLKRALDEAERVQETDLDADAAPLTPDMAPEQPDQAPVTH